MALTVTAATARFNREMMASEAAIADALVAATSLMHTAAIAQRDFPDAPVIQSQSALLHLNKMLASLIESRGEAARVHGQLRDIGREMGATEIPFCPDAEATLPLAERAA
ncbi:hypothetical protein J3454_15595 [Erythrobacter sp. NFXS35]|uniref:hypothetical protein n=1 Tax=Erythrobacter sp. NFXS35 TaxID=2818436 RepID=UPI0032DF387E